MDGREFISVAQSLLTHPDAPAVVRSAVSRAYYGAYHYACDVLRQVGCTRTAAAPRHDKGPVLCRTKVREVRAAGQKLIDLGEQRRRADYDMHDRAIERSQNGLAALENARDIVKWLSLCDDPGIARSVGQDLRQAGLS